MNKLFETCRNFIGTLHYEASSRCRHLELWESHKTDITTPSKVDGHFLVIKFEIEAKGANQLNLLHGNSQLINRFSVGQFHDLTDFFSLSI